MLARTHVLSGAAAWAGVCLATGVPGTLPEVAAGAVVAGGAALLPDLDHRRGTAAQTWGPITRLLGRQVGKWCGGHRNGTHTFAAALAAGVGVQAVLLGVWWLATVIVALLVGLVLVAWEVLLPGKWERLWPVNLAVSLAAGWVLVASGVADGWLPAAVFLGWVAHILGDAVTVMGVRPYKPWSARRLRLSRLRTGGGWETVAGWLFGWAAVLLVLAGAR